MSADVEMKDAPNTEPKVEENGVGTEEKGEKSAVVDMQPVEEETVVAPASNGHATTEISENPAESKNGTNESMSELAASVKHRQRKKVERFLPSLPQSEDRAKDFSIPKGSGLKLGDLDNVEFRITRTDVDDLKPLHRIIYGSAGKATQVRRNLRAFCGFDFEGGSAQYEKKLEAVKRFTAKGMKFVLQLLDLETKGDREELEQRLMQFLMSPHPSGRKSIKEAAKEAQEKQKKQKERKRALLERKRLKTEKKKAAKEAKKAKVKKAKSPKKSAEPKTKKKSASSDDGESGNSDSSEDESDSGSDSSENESDTSVSSNSSASSTSPSPAKKAKPAPTKKAASPVKSPSKKAKIQKADTLVKNISSADDTPSDEDLHSVISEFVSSADLETVTMKNVIAHVFGKYPSYDLSGRKAWIKETVKQLVAAAP